MQPEQTPAPLLPPEESNDPRTFVVGGGGPLAFRLVEELTSRYDVRVTAIVAPSSEDWGGRIRRLPGIVVVDAERLDNDAYQRAGVAEAAGIALVDQDDSGNVDAALLAQEINPDIRIVVRMFNVALGHRIAQLLNDCVVMSAAEIAGPAFVAAALDEPATAMTVAGRPFVATRRSRTRAEDVVAGLAVLNTGPVDPDLLPPPESEGRTDLVLARGHPPEPATRPRVRRRSTAAAVLLGARLRIVLGVLLAIFLAGTAVLTWITGNVVQSAYVVILSELTGANADANAPAVEKVTLTVLTIVSIALIPALTAAIVDSTVKARLRAERGGLRGDLSEHIVVVGLGHVGSRVIRDLCERGIEVVAIERDPEAVGVQVARELDISVIIGDASQAEVLNSARVDSCRALVVVSTDDVVNLEISLLGRSAQPNLRVVLRLFDGDFARRVQRAFAINTSRSVTFLAAPAFAASLLGRNVIATVPVRRSVLIVAELPVRAGSRLEHHTVDEVNRPSEVRLLAIRTGRDETVWFPSGDRRLVRTDSLVVVATRAGFGRLLVDTRTQRNLDGPPPQALPAPWETPHQVPDLGRPRHAADSVAEPVRAESAVDNQAARPADNDSTRPA